MKQLLTPERRETVGGRDEAGTLLSFSQEHPHSNSSANTEYEFKKITWKHKRSRNGRVKGLSSSANRQRKSVNNSCCGWNVFPKLETGGLTGGEQVLGAASRMDELSQGWAIIARGFLCSRPLLPFALCHGTM